MKKKRFNFSERMRLQKEYELFLKEHSERIGAFICPSSVTAFMQFLESKNFEIVEKEKK